MYLNVYSLYALTIVILFSLLYIYALYTPNISYKSELIEYDNNSIINGSVKVNGKNMNKVEVIYGDLYIDEEYKNEFHNLKEVNNIIIDGATGNIEFRKLKRCNVISIKNSNLEIIAFPNLRKLSNLYIENLVPTNIYFPLLTNCSILTIDSCLEDMDFRELYQVDELTIFSDYGIYSFPRLRICSDITLFDENFLKFEHSLQEIKNISIVSEGNLGKFQIGKVQNAHFENLDTVEITLSNFINSLSIKNVKKLIKPNVNLINVINTDF